MTPLHEHARALAEAGIPIFPCLVDGKAPASPNGFKDATTDLGQIDAWWSQADYNIALVPEDAGWLVVDLDPGGEENWVKLVQENGGHEPTYEVRTPRGGRHLYFAGSGNSSVQRLAGHVDTRGIAGYVLVPPSVVSGKPYTVDLDRDITPLPAWIPDLLGRERVHVKADDRVEPDQPQNIERAIRRLRDLVTAGRVARKGSGGDALTYATAAEVMDLGVSPELAGDLILEHWYPHCDPNTNDDFVRVKVANAAKYRENDIGAWAAMSSAEAFGQYKPMPETGPKKKSRFAMRPEADQEAGRDPAWLVQDLIMEASTVLLAGPTQSYKSFLALDIALSIAAGVPTFGADPLQGVAVYAALEGLPNIERARRRAWKIGRGIDAIMADFYTTVAPAIGFPGETQEFGDQLAEILSGRKLRLVVLDTLTKSMAGLNENDSRDAGQFVKFCDNLVEDFGCSVIAIHHMGKDTARGARGSSAFHAGFDTVLEVKKVDTAAKAVEVWVRKHKDAEERGIPWTFKGQSVGQSLVFFPTSQDTHREVLIGQDPYHPMNISRILVAAGATSRVAALTTSQVAIAISGPEGLGDETLVRKLEKLAGAALRTLAERDETGWLWWLPLAGDEQ